MGKDSFCPMQPAQVCSLSPPSMQKGALWAGGGVVRAGSWGGRRQTLGRPPLIPQGPAVAGGALQLSDNSSSSLVMHSLQRPRNCHIKSILISTFGQTHFLFSLTDCAEVDF